MIVGLDVDEVLADLHTPWLKWGNARWGTDHQHFTHWDAPIEWWGPEWWHFLTPNIYRDNTVLPLEGAVTTVRLLREMGHDIAFVSSCGNAGNDPELVEAKWRWLVRWGFAQQGCVYELIPGRDKSHAPVDMLVDDGFHNVRDFKNGVAVLVTAPHNRAEKWPNRIPHIVALPAVLAASR